MCTKHQLGDNLGDDSPAHYLLTCTFNRILRIVLSTSLVTLLIAEISLEMVIFFMSLIMHALSNPYILIRYRFDQNILLTLRICNQHADFTNRIWNLHKLGFKIKTLINFKGWILTKWRGSVSNIFCWSSSHRNWCSSQKLNSDISIWLFKLLCILSTLAPIEIACISTNLFL